MQTLAPSFRKAERKSAKARIALCSPAGGGKTHSALLIATGLGGRIAVVDTENGSASLEAGKAGIPDFDVLEMHAPFTPEKYVIALKTAEDAGYDVVLLDSLSHAWAGTGGLLEQVDNIARSSKSGNSYMAWKSITPMQNKLIEAILQSKCHVIGTMRTKVDFALVDDNGKKVPKKLGMAPIQREGMDYEMTICWDIDQSSHIATCTKDRTSLFDGVPQVLTIETGKTLAAWLTAGTGETQAERRERDETEPDNSPVTDEEMAHVLGPIKDDLHIRSKTNRAAMEAGFNQAKKEV